MALRSLATVLLFAGLMGVCGVGCSGKQTSTRPLLPPEMNTEESLAAPPIENVQAPITHLERQDVVETIDAGFGKFLQDFETEPSLTESGQFRGFRIVRVFDRDKYEGLGIGVGDVITSVNGKPIERPDQAFAVFMSLRTASSLDIDYLRGDRPMRLSLPIVGEAHPPKEAPPPTVETSTSPDEAESPPQ